MNHSLCALIHYVYALQAAGITFGGFSRIPSELSHDIPEALRLRLIETKGPENSLDYFWVRITESGITAALEGLCAMEAVA